MLYFTKGNPFLNVFKIHQIKKYSTLAAIDLILSQYDLVGPELDLIQFRTSSIFKIPKWLRDFWNSCLEIWPYTTSFEFFSQENLPKSTKTIESKQSFTYLHNISCRFENILQLLVWSNNKILGSRNSTRWLIGHEHEGSHPGVRVCGQNFSKKF